MVLLVELLKLWLRVSMHGCSGAWLQPLTGASIYVQAFLAAIGTGIQGISPDGSFCTKSVHCQQDTCSFLVG